jgi:hypothetical protein
MAGSTRGKAKSGRRGAVGREAIARAIAERLEPLDFVHALWEAGAASFDRIDTWSDIDLNADVDDDKIEPAFEAVEAALVSLAPIAINFRFPHPPGHSYEQAFYHLKGTSRFLLVDLALFRRSSPEKYLEPEVHGPARFLFRKETGPAPVHLDRHAQAGRIRQRLERIRMRTTLFGPFVEKEIQRGNQIEAVYNYQKVVLDSLLEVLRMRYKPERFDFGFRYVHHELPPAVIRKLEPLYFIRNRKDLIRKHRIAERWLVRALASIDPEAIEHRSGNPLL